jgi:anti-sigma B factor antagonist
MSKRDMANSPELYSKLKLPMPDETAETSLVLDIERDGNTAIVRCRGRLVAGVNDFLYIEVRQLIPDHTRIVLDLTDLTHMDSMGLGALIRLYVSCKSAKRELELINLGKRIRQLLGMTNLLSVFTVIGENGVKIT